MLRKSNRNGGKVKLIRLGVPPYCQPASKDIHQPTKQKPGSDLECVLSQDTRTYTQKRSEHKLSSNPASGQTDRLPGSRLMTNDRTTSGCHSRLLLSSQRPPPKTFPGVVDNLSERAESWCMEGLLCTEFAGGQPMNTAPRVFQPKRGLQSFRINLTKPYSFSYYKTIG